ncbi:uncharacterized protein DEA37_0010853, partial [Paragonimus westermani]
MCSRILGVRKLYWITRFTNAAILILSPRLPLLEAQKRNRSKQVIDNLVQRLNSCHPNLKVTCEFEVGNCLPFLDILISRREDGSVRRTVCKKPTGSSQYLNFSIFTPIQHKRTL